MSDIDSSLPIKTESDVDEKVQSKIVDFTTPTQGMEVDTDNDAHVKAKLRDDAGNPFGIEANPVYTVIGDDPADEVFDYQTSAAVAKDATVNHDYTVTALKTMKGVQMVVSSSGEFKVELMRETGVAAGTYDTILTAFAQASSPLVDITIQRILQVAAGVNIRIAITNRDNARDVYSTLLGMEV